jgi:hydrogenase nickel incorporation protein HypA/HybF
VHELAIAHSLVELVQQHLPPGRVRVTAVDLRVGALAGVVGDALEFCFGIATDGTPLADAILRIEDVPVVVHCAVCDCDGTIEMPAALRCPTCHTPSGDVRHGRELELASIEYDTGEEASP